MSTLHPFSSEPKQEQVHLRILETTDLHAHIYPYDYYSDQPSERVGLARAATLIGRLRGEVENTLLVDNGDFLQGNPIADYMAYAHPAGGRDHPIFKAMNTLGYDAGTIGNHEFNYGLDFLMQALEGAAFPIVCANVERGGQPLVAPYVMLDRMVRDGRGTERVLKIGVIGFVPPQVMIWDRKNLTGKVTAKDILDAAQEYVPQMKAAGADIILALSHSGIGAAEPYAGMEDASVPLAALDGIDVLVTGHSHLVFPDPRFEGMQGVDVAAGTLSGKPAVMAGSWGSHLGVIDLLLEEGAAGWQVVASRSAAVPVAGDQSLVAKAEVIESVRGEHEATLAYVRRPVGRSIMPLHSYFALVANDPSVRLVQQAKTARVHEMLVGTEWEGLPLLSAAAPFKSGGRGGPEFYTDVPAGDLALRHIADLYIYPNMLRAILLSGAQVMDWLERAVSIYHQITPGAVDQPLLNSDVPMHTFDMLAGLRYEIDLSQPAKFDADGALLDADAKRISGLSLAEDAQFVVATNNYRADGGGGFPGAGGDTVILEGTETVREVLLSHVAKLGDVGTVGLAGWSFKAMPDTSVVFDTGPGALKYAGSSDVELVGDGPDGFLRYRLRL